MYTAYATFTISCPEDETGPSVTKGASASSVISQRDADVKALGLAQRLAYEFLNCLFPPDPDIPRFCSAPVTVDAFAQAGYVPQTFRVNYPACAVYSLVSQADADAAALLAAQLEANHDRDIGQKLIFFNDAQTYSNTCAAVLGSNYGPVTYSYTIDAGLLESHTSQAAANLEAMELAKANVLALLVANCVPSYKSVAVSYTASCTDPLVGAPVTVSYPVGAYHSDVSQADADTMALTAATTAANALLSCAAGYWNVEKSSTVTCLEEYGPNWFGSDASATIPARSYFASTQMDADAAAQNAAEIAAAAKLVCTWGGGVMP